MAILWQEESISCQGVEAAKGGIGKTFNIGYGGGKKETKKLRRNWKRRDKLIPSD